MNTDQTDSAGKTPAFSSLGFAPRDQPFGYEQQPDVYVSPPASPHVPQAGRPNVERGEAVQEQYGGDVPNTNRLPPGSPGNAAPAVSPIENQQVPVQTIHPNTVGQNNPTARGHDIVSPLSTGNSLFGGFPQDSANSTPDLRRDRFSRQADQGRFDDVPTQPYYTAPTPSNDYHQFLQTIHHPKGTSVRSGKGIQILPPFECIG